MRVLLLTHRLPYAPNRGDRVRAFHLLHTVAIEADVHLASLTQDDDEAGHAEDLVGIATRVDVARVPRVRNLARGLVRLHSTTPLTHLLLEAPDLVKTLRTAVEQQPPDVVLACGSAMARVALTEPLRPFPLVLDLLAVDSARWAALARASRAPMSWVYRREVRWLSVFEQVAAEAAAATIVASEAERDLLLALAPGARVHVVPNGIALDAFRRPDDLGGPDGGEAHDGPLVVFCGTMSDAANRQAALTLAQEIWPRVTARRPDARLALIGANPDRTVRHLPAADPSIEVTGGLPDVRPYLWRAALLVTPVTVARAAGSRVLEALAAGVPCLVTPVVHQGLPADVRPGCRVAEGSEGFAESIVGMLALPDTARRTIASGARLSELTWEGRLGPVVRLLRAAAEGGLRVPKGGKASSR